MLHDLGMAALDTK